ncbi:MAG TPA: DUF3305 domain-containing protein [Rhodocyclaceae bacterium]|nr:DUF3305 domain-containing protein [Rhodocyclaceae bacterium]
MTMRHLSVVMERRALHNNRWTDHQWEVISVLPDRGDSEARCLLREDGLEQWLYPALQLALHGDDVDGYLLNLSAPTPRLFVAYRTDDVGPVPFLLTLSYDEAARMMDSGETVDGIVLPEELWRWVADYAKANWRPPEPKKKGKHYASTQEAAL